MVTEITERKTAEEKDPELEPEFRQILEHTPQVIAIFAPNRERFYAIRPVLDYLGVTLEEAL